MAAVKSDSFVTPPMINAETSATRAARQVQGHARIAEIHRGVSARSFISDSPAGTAERPECSRIGSAARRARSGYAAYADSSDLAIDRRRSHCERQKR